MLVHLFQAIGGIADPKVWFFVRSSTELQRFLSEKIDTETKEEIDTVTVQDSGYCRNENTFDPPNIGHGGGAGTTDTVATQPALRTPVFYQSFLGTVSPTPPKMVCNGHGLVLLTGKETPPSVLCL